MDQRLNYYNVKYNVLNEGKIYTFGEKIVLGLSEEHARENFIPEMLNSLQVKQDYANFCSLTSQLEFEIRSIKRFDGVIVNFKKEFVNEKN